MKVKYIRRDIPEEISEDGGAFIQLVGKTTIGLTSSIKEAIRTLYCVGEASLIEGYFVGLVRSVFAGIKSDGAARSIGDIRFYPVCGGTFDLEKGWDPAVNDVRIKAQLVNGVELDISDWQFEDVTEGRVAFSVESVSDGTVSGQVSTNKNVQINGKNFPADVSVSWVCGTKSGTVEASKLTRSVSRLDIDKSAFATLTEAEDGLPIVFTLKGSYNKATAKAVVNYAASEPTITKTTQNSNPDNTLAAFDGLEWTIHGENLDLATGDSVWLEQYDGTGKVKEHDCTAKMASSSSTAIEMSGMDIESSEQEAWCDTTKQVKLVVKRGSKSASLTVTMINS